MTNGEKYKTAEERDNAYGKYLDNLGYGGVAIGKFYWLDLEAEPKEKPMPCPFCGKLCGVSYMPDGDEESGDENAYAVMCENCGYHSAWGDTRDAVVTVHNRICKAVDAYNESEVTNG